MPRVRVPWPLQYVSGEESPVALNVYRNGRLERSPVVAYATGLTMRDTVLLEGVKTEGYAISQNYIEGELTGWIGRFREQAEPGLKKILVPLRLASVFHSHADLSVLAMPLPVRQDRAYRPLFVQQLNSF